jgi:cytochrome P450
MATAVSELELPLIDGMDRASRRQQVAEARDRHWLARAPLGYALTRYDDCISILRDGRWHSALAVLNDVAGITDPRMQRRRPSILTTEGAEHTRLRRLVGPAFTPKQADSLRPLMAEVVDGLVDAVAAEGRCDLVADVGEPYPIPIICALVGAPREDWKLFSRLASSVFRIFDDDVNDHIDEIVAARDEMDAYVTGLIEERRAAPRDDLLSELIRAEEEGDRLSNDELLSLVEALILAGTDTTRNQLACSVALLAQHPDQWALLGDQPELAPRAVEETMRHLGAIRGTGRFASEDLEYRDVLFPAGTLLWPSLVSANHDPEVWEEPETFDITAPREKAQITFGSGVHFCLGASLARAELQEALTILARRMPDLRLDGDVEWKPESVGIWGPSRLPLAFRREGS